MEEMPLEDELKLFDAKREYLGKVMEKMKSQANDALIFTLQWSDLEDHLKSAEDKLGKRFKELVSKELELAKRAKVVEAAEAELGEFKIKADGFKSEIEEKREELGVLKKSLEECTEEQMSKRVQVREMVELLRKTQSDCDFKVGELSQLETILENYRGEVNSEKERLNRTKTSRIELEVELERKTEDLALIVTKIENCEKQFETKSSKLIKTQVEVELKGKQFEQMAIDLERHRGQLNAEKDHLGRIENFRKELEVEMEQKKKDLALIVTKIEECEKQFETKSSKLMKTQVEVELKGKQFEQMTIDLERHCGALNAEKDHLGRIENIRKELEVEIEQTKKDRTAVLDEIAECRKQLDSVEKQLDSQQKLLETLSSELVSKKKEYEGLILDLDLAYSVDKDMKKICQKVESKAKELKAIEMLISERSGRSESIKLLLEEHTEELASREKKQNEMMEAIRTLSSELVNKEKTLERADALINELYGKQILEQEKVESTELHFLRITEDCDSKKRELVSVKARLRECLENLEIKERELKSLQLLITEINEQVEEGEKKKQHLNISNEELIRQLQVKQEEVTLINKVISESSDEMELLSVKDKLRVCLENLEIKQKELQVFIAERNKQFKEGAKKKQHLDNSIEELTRQLQLKQEEVSLIKKAVKESSDELHSKRKNLDQLRSSYTDLTADIYSVKKKIQEKKEQHAKVMVSLMELVSEKKQFDARVEKIELKEKEFDEREKNLKSMEQNLAKSVEDYELKAKKLASFIQLSNMDQHVDLAPDAKVCDEKTLQLLVLGHLEKFYQLYLDVSNVLNASSEPEKLVLHTIQELHQRMVKTNLGPNSVTRSSIILLDCLMIMSSKPSTEVQEEALKCATEWKNTALDKANNPVEVLGCLNVLAAFSLAYNFDAEEVKNLFDVEFILKYAPSLCEVLDLSSLAPVNNVQSLNALLDIEGSPTFSPNEVTPGLQVMKNPASDVLHAVDDAVMDSQRRGELGLSEPILKNLVLLLEELQGVVKPSDRYLPYASRVAGRWSATMSRYSQISPLEAWGFLQLIVAYGLVLVINRKRTFEFASYVAHFRQAPKLFESLGFINAIPYFVNQLLSQNHYIPAIRFIKYFNVNCSTFHPLPYLKSEIVNLTSSAKVKRIFDPEAEDKDAAKLRDMIGLIEDFKLDIDLPVDLIVKFMVPRDFQTPNQCVVSSSVLVPPPQVTVQYSKPVIQGSCTCITTHVSNPNLPTSSSASPNPLLVEPYQAGGSTMLQVRGESSSLQAGLKRQRVAHRDPRRQIRQCLGHGKS